jgi:signal transduction histidine kinase
MLEWINGFISGAVEGMRLSEFILTYRDRILAEWVIFAQSCLRHPTADTMDTEALRDDGSAMLVAIAEDLNTEQSESEQTDKSKGRRDAKPYSGEPGTAAQMHGAARAETGFSVEQVFSEYRALRASVTRLWIKHAGALGPNDFVDLGRFNEAIDQALAESITRYTHDVNRSRDMFLGILGHDLRTPLGTMIGAAHAMVHSKEFPEKLLKMASLILTSGQRMDALVGDLLDFTRSRLGRGIPIVRANMDIGDVGRQTVEEIAVLYPRRVVNFERTGDLQGEWDRSRVSQALSNVIGNAVQHGAENTPINVTICGETDEVRLAVQNWGSVIPANQLNQIFEPMYRIQPDIPTASGSHIGLGLYIAERIVAAHGGTVAVESSEQNGTTFTIHLPKRIGLKSSREKRVTKNAA